MPGLKSAFFSWVRASIADIRYIGGHEKIMRTRLKMIFKAPALNLLSVLGQYNGARDELAGIEKKIEGV